ncbi:response regulator transcription factor [Aliamphritea spongicola]|uniref:response regulator transcription factor n=1 Tax=Aliamphritea spongicola TaxID=707589 RepID=UPI00196AF5F8|nr:response regulator transcription factor [Aliamphritea spongicola]MBN3563012.1 response regulator transcription factor [Aliamphritea spongicola]
MRVLIVEDNQDLAANLTDYLELKNCITDWAGNGRQALNLTEHATYDVIVLDIMMPVLNGLDVCRKLREQHRQTPILFLTARDTLDDKIEGFAVGGDDYLVKPFAMEELYLRLDALCKRRPRQQADCLQVADLIMDLTSQEVTRAGKPLKLNRSCLKLLQHLMQHSPEVVSREDLSQTLWGNDAPDQDVLRSHLYHLRTAIDKPFDTQLLHTVYGVGFRLSDTPPKS